MSGRAGRYKTYSVNALEKAKRFVKETGASIKLAARKFGVPPSTINDHLKKKGRSDESVLKIKNETESAKAETDKSLLKIPVVTKANKPSDTEEVNGQKSRSPRKRRLTREVNSLQSLSEVEDDVKDCKEDVKMENDGDSLSKVVVPNLSRTKTIKASPELLPDPIPHKEPTDPDEHGNDTFKRKKYSKEKLYTAYQYLLTHPTESITMVARKFGVPTTTLRDRWTGRVRVTHPTNFRPILPKPEIPSGQVHPVCLEKVNLSKWNAIDKLIRCQPATATLNHCQSDQNVCISYTNTLNDSTSFQGSAVSPVLSPVPSTCTLQNNMSHIQVMASQPVGSTSNPANNLAEKSPSAENGEDGKQSHVVSHRQTRQNHSQELPAMKREQGTEERKSGVVMFNDIQIKQEPGVVDLSQVIFNDEQDIKAEDDDWDYNERTSNGSRNLRRHKKKSDRTLTVRLIYKNLQGKKKGRKSYKLYPKEALEKAVAFIRDEGGSPSKASEIFGVPQSTIGDRLRQMGIIRRPKHESRRKYNLWKTGLRKRHTESNLEESSGNNDEDADKSDADRSNVCLTTLASEITSFNDTDSGGNSVVDQNYYEKDQSCIMEENDFQNRQSQDESDGQIEGTVPIEGSYVPSMVSENLGTDSNLSSQDSQNTQMSLKSSDQEESSSILSSSQADPSDDTQSKKDLQYKDGYRQNRYRKYSCFPVRDRVYKRRVKNRQPAASSETRGVTKTRNYKNYTQESLQKACDYVMIWNKSVAEASRLYGVPCTTIWDKMHKQKTSAKSAGKSQSAGAAMEHIVQNQLVPKIMKDVKTGRTSEVIPSPSVSEQSNKNHEKRVRTKSSKSRENWVETRLSWYLFDMAEIGYRFSEDEIIQIVSELRGDCCSNAWLCTLLDLYPTLSNVLGGYNFSVTSSMVNFYYNKLDQLLEEKDLFKRPELVYMLDISCVVFEKNCARFVEAHRFTPSSLMVNDLDTEVVSVIGCANALGTALPPFYITPADQPLSNIDLSCPGAQSVASDSGRCTTSKLMSYMQEHFCRFSQTGRGGHNVPVVVLYNPYQAPVTLNLLTWAEESNIHLFAVPPHTYSSSLEGGTTQLTSSDVGLFGSVYEDTLISECSTPYSQAEVLTKAYQKTLVSHFVINRFINNGTFPVNLKRYGKLQDERSSGLDNRPPKVPFIKKEPLDFSDCEPGTTQKDTPSPYKLTGMNNMAPETKASSSAADQIDSITKDSNIHMSTDTKTSPDELLGKKVSELLQGNIQANVPPKGTAAVHRRKRKGQPKQALHVKMFNNGDSIESYSLGMEAMQSNGGDSLCEKGEGSCENTVATNQDIMSSNRFAEEDVGITEDEDIMTVAGYKIVLADDDDDDDEC